MPEPKLPKVEVPPEKPHVFKSFTKGFAGLFWDLVGIKSAGDAMTEHALTVEKKGRFLASAFIFLIVCIGMGLGLRGCYDESEIRSSDDNARSNDALAKSYKSQLDAANSIIIQLKVDANEVKREKDAEIEKLTTEKSSLQQQLGSYQAAHVMEISSNFDSSISNILSGAKNPMANLILEVNDTTNLTPIEIAPGVVFNLTNFITIKDGKIRAKITNRSKHHAINSYVCFFAAIDPTNLVADGWHPQPQARSGEQLWRYDTDRSLPSNPAVSEFVTSK